MFHRTYRFWRGSLGSPVVKGVAKRLFPLMVAAALCLPGAPVAVTAADVAPPEPLSSGMFGHTSDSVTPCSAEAGGACPVSWTTQELDTPPPPQEHHATGFIAPPMDLSYLTVESLPGRLSASDSITETFDWRDRGGANYVTPVRDQSSCGACYAFAALGNIESKVQIDGVAPAPDYSENHAKDCTWIGGNVPGWGGCTGGNYMMLANLYSKTGTVAEADDAYTPVERACQSPAGPYQTTMLGWQMISGPTAAPTSTIKQALVGYGPVYSAIYAGDVQDPTWDATFNSYDGSTVLNYVGGVATTNHAVLIVGWDDTATYSGGQGAWVAKNSWGTAWGDNGYFMIAYGSAGIGTYVSYMTEWQSYDNGGDVWHYDEGGWAGSTGYVGNHTAWGLNVFTATEQTNVTRVEFWAPDVMPDVDISLYDTFDGGSLSGLLWQSNDNTTPTAGYYSVPLDAPLTVAPGDNVVTVVRFTAQATNTPVPWDSFGPVSG
ncbi:MAG: lectin like domain-containing protein, partial [Anaerolineae bacterium]|nr:lectin like domain-containing protein [Anaerolineae bacterium]